MLPYGFNDSQNLFRRRYVDTEAKVRFLAIHNLQKSFCCRVRIVIGSFSIWLLNDTLRHDGQVLSGWSVCANKAQIN